MEYTYWRDRNKRIVCIQFMSDRWLKNVKRRMANTSVDTQPIVDEINQLEDKFKGFSDEELKSKTKDLRSNIKDGKTLDDILPVSNSILQKNLQLLQKNLEPVDIYSLSQIIHRMKN